MDTAALTPSPHYSVRHEGAGDQWMEDPPKQWSVRLGSYPDGASRSSGDNRALSGAPANLWAVTRVNPEQASKGKLRTPTRLNNGEGRCAEGKQPTDAPSAVRRGSGNSTWGRFSGQRGKPAGERGRDLRCRLGRQPSQVSERPIVPRKPGNAGGGKGPHFWMLRRELWRGDWREP